VHGEKKKSPAGVLLDSPESKKKRKKERGVAAQLVILLSYLRQLLWEKEELEQ